MKTNPRAVFLCLFFALAAAAPAHAAWDRLPRDPGGAPAAGSLDSAALARALERRAALVAETRAKRAGLPGTPTGWTNLTGYPRASGRINHILFTSSTGNDLLAGADGGGIWRSTNGGQAWVPVDDFLGSLSIANFARADNNANVIYAGTNPRGSHTYFPFGIIKSVDGGATWAQLPATNPGLSPAGTHALRAAVDPDPPFTYVQRVAVHPANPNHVLAATEGGAYESRDGGATWSLVGGITTRAYHVAFHPTTPARHAVAYDGGTLRYTTTGDLQLGSTTVTVVAGGRYMRFAYAKSDVSRVYALVSSAPGLTKVMISMNGGGSWMELFPPTASRNGKLFNDAGWLASTGALWVDPANANRIAVGENWAWFTQDTTDGPPLWKEIHSGAMGDFQGIVEHPGYDGTTNRVVYWMDGGGLYRTADVNLMDLQTFPPTQFVRLEGGMTVTQVYSVSGHGGNPILGAHGVSTRVHRTSGSDPAPRWSFVADTACPGCEWLGHGTTTAASTASPNVLYGSSPYLDMFRSTDGGVTATSIVRGSALNQGRGATTPNFNAAFLAPFVLDPSNASRMYAGGLSLWRSDNVDTGNPPHWTSIRGPQPGCFDEPAPVSTIAVAASNPDIAWIAYGCTGAVFRTANATAASPAWSEVATLPPEASLRSKGAILIDAANPNVVWIGLAQYQAGTLFKTTDGGATWSVIAGLPGAPVYALLQHPAVPSWLYAGTGVGLFASNDGGATWSTSNEGPANVVVRSLDWNTTTPSAELLVGTFGRGVFKAMVAANPARLGNISTRGQSLTGNDVMIAGFIIGGPASKTVVVRARGQSLVPFGIPNPLADPRLQLVRSSDSATLATNDDWGGAPNAAAIAASGFAPDNPSESAIMATLPPGAYTAIVSGAGGGTGVAIVEVFEVDALATPLVNISTRGSVSTGSNVMIGGFVIQGEGPRTVVVRARGPSLVPFGIANALADPQLQLVRSSDQATLAANNDWQGASNAAAVAASGFAPSNALESAILMTLAPGAYTAIVSGVGGGTGVGIVEVFAVP